MRLRVLAELNQPAIVNFVDVELLVTTCNESLAIRMSENIHRTIRQQNTINDLEVRRREID